MQSTTGWGLVTPWTVNQSRVRSCWGYSPRTLTNLILRVINNISSLILRHQEFGFIFSYLWKCCILWLWEMGLDFCQILPCSPDTSVTKLCWELLKILHSVSPVYPEPLIGGEQEAPHSCPVQLLNIKVMFYFCWILSLSWLILFWPCFRSFTFCPPVIRPSADAPVCLTCVSLLIGILSLSLPCVCWRVYISNNKQSSILSWCFYVHVLWPFCSFHWTLSCCWFGLTTYTEKVFDLSLLNLSFPQPGLGNGPTSRLFRKVAVFRGLFNVACGLVLG